MKQLLYFPIVHNQTDLGSLREGLSIEGEKRYGKTEWKNHLKQIQESWNRVEELTNQYLNTNNLPMNKVRIYQDGLPVSGEIGLKIVREVATQGSRNYQILGGLINRGAYLEEAEDKELLFQEHGYLSKILKATTQAEKLKQYILYREVSQDLLDRRDRYIAERINTTLNECELGLAFFGGIHSIVDKLMEDIEVTVVQEFNDRISTNLINLGRKYGSSV